MDSKTLIGIIRPEDKPAGQRFLHRFSDSLLHSSLMIAIVLLVSVVMFKAISVGVSVWMLEPVVIQGQAKTPGR